ncbi:MAG: hypothetical protein HYS56_02765 [Candidatus Omnitrophica bacterium]|nr:hypothetical protein [Candidatus Omnitrophota bacterium]
MKQLSKLTVLTVGLLFACFGYATFSWGRAAVLSALTDEEKASIKGGTPLVKQVQMELDGTPQNVTITATANDAGRITVTATVEGREVRTDLDKLKEEYRHLADGSGVLSYQNHEIYIDDPVRQAIETGRSRVLSQQDTWVQEVLAYLDAIGDTRRAAALREVIAQNRLLLLTPDQGEDFVFEGHASLYAGGSIYLTVTDPGVLIHELGALLGYTHQDNEAWEKAFNAYQQNQRPAHDQLFAALPTDTTTPEYAVKKFDAVINAQNTEAFVFDADQTLANAETSGFISARTQTAHAAGKPVVAIVADPAAVTRESLIERGFYVDAVVPLSELPGYLSGKGVDPTRVFGIVQEWQQKELRTKYSFDIGLPVAMPNNEIWDLLKVINRSRARVADDA